LSYSRGLTAVKLKRTDKVPVWDNISHIKWIKSRAEQGEAFLDTYRRLLEVYDIDIVPSLPSKKSIYGTALQPLPHVDEEFIYCFDPFHPPDAVDYVDALGIAPAVSVEEMAEHFYTKHMKLQNFIGERALVPGAQWHQIFHYFTTTFGLESTSYAAFSKSGRFINVVDRFAELSRKIYEAWAMTGVKFMICHDDLGMVDRTIFPPEWYREVLYPRYEYIWHPLIKAGIPFVFFSDGKTDALLPDISNLGPNGLYMDDMVDFEKMARLVGQKLFLLGNAKTSILMLGTEQDIKNDIQRCFDIGRKCKQHIMSCSGGLMENLPIQRVELYMELVEQFRKNKLKYFQA